MIIFQSLEDILIDSILDLDKLSSIQRRALLYSMYGVPFHMFNEELKTAFRTAIIHYLNSHKSLQRYYERG